MGGGATRERGHPARRHSRCVPLSFPAIPHPATLPARTAPGLCFGRALAPLPVDPGGWRWPRLCHCCAGGTPALPGGLHPITSSQ